MKEVITLDIQQLIILSSLSCDISTKHRANRKLRELCRYDLQHRPKNLTIIKRREVWDVKSRMSCIRDETSSYKEALI
jgi:hypothetical protein